jgi:hypothetical protein
MTARGIEELAVPGPAGLPDTEVCSDNGDCPDAGALPVAAGLPEHSDVPATESS